MCLLAVGSQTGGSIVRPASYCGVAGLKPSHGRVSAKGVIPISAHLDHVGPIARNVSDLAVGFSVMTGEMIPDLFLSPGAGFVPRLATIEPYFFEQADASLIAVTRQSLDHCRSAGAAITSLHLPPSFAAAHAMHYRLMAADAAAYHHTEFERDRAAFGPKLTELIDNGLAITGVQYSAALTHQRQFREELLGILPVQCIALTPSTPTAAPASLSTTGDPRFNSPWSFAGFPTVTIPCGLSPDGMPCGLQLIGRPGSEWELLTAAGWCESQIGFKSLDRTKE